MVHQKEQFIKILKIELTNLVEDISDLISYEKELHDKEKHSNFVYLENLVVLKDEIMGINGVLGELDRLEKSMTIENFVQELEFKLKEFITKRGYPLAVNELLKRKIKKVDLFLTSV